MNRPRWEAVVEDVPERVGDHTLAHSRILLVRQGFRAGATLAGQQDRRSCTGSSSSDDEGVANSRHRCSRGLALRPCDDHCAIGRRHQQYRSVDCQHNWYLWSGAVTANPRSLDLNLLLALEALLAERGVTRAAQRLGVSAIWSSGSPAWPRLRPSLCPSRPSGSSSPSGGTRRVVATLLTRGSGRCCTRSGVRRRTSVRDRLI